MSRPTIDEPVRFLVEHGLLFEINRQVLHPLGLQLDLEADADGTTCELVLEDNRASPDPIYFTTEQFEEGRRKYEAYLQDAGRLNMQKRRRIGMVIQSGPNLPRHIHGEESS